MKRLVLGAISAFAVSAPLHAQGVPTVDATQFAQLVRQLEAQARDYTAQIEQLAALKTQVETQVNQLLNLESQLAALVEGTGVGKLFASVAEFQQLLGSLSNPLDVMDDIASGNWAGTRSNARTGVLRPPCAPSGTARRRLPDYGLRPRGEDRRDSEIREPDRARRCPGAVHQDAAPAARHEERRARLHRNSGL